MDVIRKTYCVLILLALISFATGVSVADERAMVNINTATVDELTVLKGIGEKKAHSIIEHRKEAGPFATIEDLKSVKGVGHKLFNEIKDLIVVE